MVSYVVGFLFHFDTIDVALIRKKRPEWQRNLLNGPGGKILDGETPAAAMRREFHEECGVTIDDWAHFATITGEDYAVWFFRASCDTKTARHVLAQTDEDVLWVHAPTVPNRKDVLDNLRWLVPLARSRYSYLVQCLDLGEGTSDGKPLIKDGA